MAKSKKTNETFEEVVGVNTPERTDEMDEKKNFFDEEKAEEPDMENDQELDEDDSEETESDETNNDVPEEKVGFFGSIWNWFKKHWKFLLGTGLVVVVGGTVFVYFMGKKKIKLGTVEEVAEKLADGDKAKVVDFSKAVEEMAKDMVKNPEEWKVENF